MVITNQTRYLSDDVEDILRGVQTHVSADAISLSLQLTALEVIAIKMQTNPTEIIRFSYHAVEPGKFHVTLNLPSVRKLVYHPLEALAKTLTSPKQCPHELERQLVSRLCIQLFVPIPVFHKISQKKAKTIVQYSEHILISQNLQLRYT